MKRLNTFLRGLAKNNTKIWFDAHREEYDALRAEFIELTQQVILLVARFDPAVQHVTAKESIYRINRDVRFSKNKQPYKTNFAATIAPGGKNSSQPGYHFSLDADGSLMVAGGLYMIGPEQLEAMRRSIARDPKKLRAILATPAFKKTFGDLDRDEALKKPPRGYPADHPAIDLLKLKRFAAWAHFPIAHESEHLAEDIAEKMHHLQPLLEYERRALV